MDFDKKNGYSQVPVDEYVTNKTCQPIYGYGYRHIQVAVLFLCTFVFYVISSHLAVTLVAMTSTPGVNGTGSVKDSFEDPYLSKPQGDMLDQNYDIFRTYDWPKSVQEIIFVSKMIGSGVMIFPMGLVVQKWGGKRPLQVSLFFNFLLSIPVPWLAIWGGWKLVCTSLVFQGMFQASLYPAVHSILANWVPVSERARFISYVYTGTNVGTVVAYQISALLCGSALGWPWVFWISGFSSFVAFIFFTIFCSETPGEHASISSQEKNFITENTDTGCKNPKAPWKSIMKSKRTWPIFIAHMGTTVIFTFTLVQVPSYMHYVLKFNIRDSGLLASIPHIAKILSAIGFGALADFCTNRNILTIRQSRVISNTIGHLGVSTCLATVTFVSSTTWAVVIFIASLGLYSAVYSGWMVSYIDIAPNFSGSLMATGNAMGQLFVLTLPLMVSTIITDMGNENQWRIVFLLIAAVGFLSNLFYALFMTSEVQDWNKQKCGATKGTNVGTVVAYQISALLCGSGLGWPWVFWTSGFLSFVAFILFTIFCSETPGEHASISSKEKNFITENTDTGCKNPKAPWKSIMTSKRTWPIFIAHMGTTVIFTFTLVQVPSYMHYVLKFNIRDSGLLASIPHIAKILSAIGFGALADFCTNRNILTIRQSRVISNTIGHLGVSTCLATVTFVSSTTWAVVIFIASLGLYSAVYSGWMVSYIDIAPNFSGSLMATGNAMGQLFVLTLPLLVSTIITDMGNENQWRIVFLLIAAVGFLSNLFYALFMTSEVQDWNKQKCGATKDKEVDEMENIIISKLKAMN